MNNRLLEILKYKELSAVKFAEIMGVQASSISHIISGRNKPSFDFIAKFIDKFPEISLEWFILGKGQMLKTNAQGYVVNDNIQPASTPSHTNATTKDLFNNNSHAESGLRSSSNINLESTLNRSLSAFDNVERIVVFYSDNTFSSFKPRQ